MPGLDHFGGGISAFVGGGNARIATEPLCFQRIQAAQLLAGIRGIVELQRVDFVGFQPLQRLSCFRDLATPSVVFKFGGDEDTGAILFRSKWRQGRFRRRHRKVRVDNTASTRHERADDVSRTSPLLGADSRLKTPAVPTPITGRVLTMAVRNGTNQDRLLRIDRSCFRHQKARTQSAA